MKNALNKLKLLVLTGLAACFSLVDKAADALTFLGDRLTGPTAPQFGLRRQGGFVLLSRPAFGYAAGLIVELSASQEAALIASGGATASNGPPSSSNQSTTALQGCCGLSIGQNAISIFNPVVTPQSIVYANISQDVADATATRVIRVVPKAGQFTIYVDANATAVTQIDWAILNPTGTLTAPY